MPVEIERKFLVRNDAWKTGADHGTRLAQSYLSIEKNRVIRIRITDKRAVLGFKSASLLIQRKEFEYDIPFEDARELIHEFSALPPVEKVRYRVSHGRHVWEVDVFTGDNEGLTLAEIELADEDEQFEKPEWLGEEVTWEEKYLNSSLYLKPFKTWRKEL